MKWGKCQDLGPENVARRNNLQWCDGLNQCSLSTFIITTQGGLVHLLQIWPWIWNNYIRDNWSGDQYGNTRAQIVAVQRHLWLPSSGSQKEAPCWLRPLSEARFHISSSSNTAIKTLWSQTYCVWKLTADPQGKHQNSPKIIRGVTRYGNSLN